MITAKDLAEAVAVLEMARRALYGLGDQSMKNQMRIGDWCVEAAKPLRRAIEEIEVKVTP
jgi:hypothetical protein